MAGLGPRRRSGGADKATRLRRPLGSKVAFISSSAGAKSLNKYFPGVEERLSSPPEVLETPLGRAGSRSQRESGVWQQLEEGWAGLPAGRCPPSWPAKEGPVPRAPQAWEAAAGSAQHAAVCRALALGLSAHKLESSGMLQKT